MRTIHVATPLLALALSSTARPADADEPPTAPIAGEATAASAAGEPPDAPIPEDPYEAAMAASIAAEKRGELDKAVAPLEAIAADYPQDYALPLRAAWLYFRAGRYAWAAGAYSTALARSPRAREARAGLGWALARLGRCDEARAHFLLLISVDSSEKTAPQGEAAREGLAFCAAEPAGAEWRVALRGALSVSLFPGSGPKSSAVSGAAEMDLFHRSGVFFGASYRYRRFFAASAGAPSASGGTDWDQHEVFARAGYASALFGIEAEYASIVDGSGTQGTSHHAGLQLRWSPVGDIVLDLAASHYDDMDVFRIAPSWRIPLGAGFSVRPGAALQVADGEALGSGSATVSLDQPLFGLYLGGKAGEEARPALLGLGIVNNASERIQWGLWAGGSVNVSRALRIDLSYSTDRLRSSDGREENSHTVTLGASGHF